MSQNSDCGGCAGKVFPRGGGIDISRSSPNFYESLFHIRTRSLQPPNPAEALLKAVILVKTTIGYQMMTNWTAQAIFDVVQRSRTEGVHRCGQLSRHYEIYNRRWAV